MRLAVENDFFGEFLPEMLAKLGHEIVERDADFTFKKREQLPITALAGLGFERSKKSDYRLVKFYDYRDGWSNQTLFSSPLVGLLNGGLGRRVEVGSVGNYVPLDIGDRLFDHERLSLLLKEMQYSGLVGLLRESSETRKEWVAGVELGDLGSDLYSLLQGMELGQLEWFRSPSTVWIKESWTVNLVVSRSPFPLSFQTDETKVGGVTESVRKHFWMNKIESETKSSITTKKTALGIVANWGRSLRKASDNALWTARNLVASEIQYRTDAEEAVSKVWERVKSL